MNEVFAIENEKVWNGKRTSFVHEVDENLAKPDQSHWKWRLITKCEAILGRYLIFLTLCSTMYAMKLEPWEK